MAKEKYYTVEKFNKPSTLQYFIGGMDGVYIAKEAEAQQIADALNTMRELRKVQREANALSGSLETFIKIANAAA